MDLFFELLKILLPSVVVFLATYYILKLQHQKELDIKKQEIRAAGSKDIFTLRMQAYERLILFLERINPQNMLMRLDKTGKSSIDLQLEILSNIRAEYEHNISQQLYISPEAWQLVNTAKEETIKFLNLCKEQLSENENALGYSKYVMAKSINTTAPTYHAVMFLKKEAQRLF
jgi:hypothetical protein